MRRTAKLCACVVAVLVGCQSKSTAPHMIDAGTSRVTPAVSAVAVRPKPVSGPHRSRYAAPEAPPTPVPAPPDVAKPPDDAKRTRTGLASKVLQPGSGETRPRRYDRVR